MKTFRDLKISNLYKDIEATKQAIKELQYQPGTPPWKFRDIDEPDAQLELKKMQKHKYELEAELIGIESEDIDWENIAERRAEMWAERSLMGGSYESAYEMHDALSETPYQTKLYHESIERMVDVEWANEHGMCDEGGNCASCNSYTDEYVEGVLLVDGLLCSECAPIVVAWSVFIAWAHGFYVINDRYGYVAHFYTAEQMQEALAEGMQYDSTTQQLTWSTN